MMKSSMGLVRNMSLETKVAATATKNITERKEREFFSNDLHEKSGSLKFRGTVTLSRA